MRALYRGGVPPRRGRVVCSETLWFSCAEHLPAWAGRVHGHYLVLVRDEWEG
ncbi:MAG: hypothetical protein ACM37V_15120 [Gemmatimonadota bacterium]